jgi:hypothetical protein
MADKIIEKLKVKPVATVPRPVVFKIGQMNTLQIQDNRKESTLNREEIMDKMKQFKKVKPLNEKVEAKQKIIIKNKKLSRTKDGEEAIMIKPKKIKKVRKKKFKLIIKIYLIFLV